MLFQNASLKKTYKSTRATFKGALCARQVLEVAREYFGLAELEAEADAAAAAGGGGQLRLFAGETLPLVCVPTAFHRPFTAFPSTFHRLSSTFQCLSHRGACSGRDGVSCHTAALL